MEKNTNAIDKIIGEMSMQCYLSARKKTCGHLKSYSLSAECLEAIETKRDYIAGKIPKRNIKHIVYGIICGLLNKYKYYKIAV